MMMAAQPLNFPIHGTCLIKAETSTLRHLQAKAFVGADEQFGQAFSSEVLAQVELHSS